MHETTLAIGPRKRANQFVAIAAQARLAHYRREAKATAARLRRARRDCGPAATGDAPPLTLIAHWAGDIEMFRDLVEMASDWGPFEMTEVSWIGDTRSRLLCRFEFHGQDATRRRHEEVLRSVLARVTRFEDPAEAAAPGALDRS